MDRPLFTHILLASDGSAGALRAAAAAATLAVRFEARLTLVSVYEPFPSIEPYGESILAGLDPRHVAEAHACALSPAGRAVYDQGVAYRTCREVGHPATEIVRLAEEEGCDLIVVGSRGQSGVVSHLLGSVSDRVAHHAPCPVLIVK